MKESLRPGFGRQLAEARAGKGLSLVDVAGKLKLSSRQVEAIEAEDLTRLPSDVFVRGFVRNYARLLGLDPEALIVPVDAEQVVSEMITAPSEGLSMAKNGLRRWLLVPLIVMGLFVALVAGLYQWLSQGEDTLLAEQALSAAPMAPALPQAPVVPAAASAAPVASPQTLAPAPDGVLQEQSAPVAPLGSDGKPLKTSSAVTAPVTNVPANTPTNTPADLPVASGKTLAGGVEKGKSQPAPGNDHTVRFMVFRDAWIQIADAQGRRYSKLVTAGAAESFAGTPPFRLVVGEASQVRLSYDGTPVDLSPYIGQKVARLTLE